MGALWSISLSNSRVKYSEKNVERKKERKREFRPRERPIVVVLCSGDSDRLRTNSGQEWEIDLYGFVIGVAEVLRSYYVVPLNSAEWRYYLRPRSKEPPVWEVPKKKRKKLLTFEGN